MTRTTADCCYIFNIIIIPPIPYGHTVVWLGCTVCFYVFVCMVTDFVAQKKIVAWNFACFFYYYPGWASGVLVNFGLGAAPPEAYIQIVPGKKILQWGSVGSRNWALYGGICVLFSYTTYLTYTHIIVCIYMYIYICICMHIDTYTYNLL